jgi:hypothetical protein
MGQRNSIVKIAKVNASVFGVTMTSWWLPSWILVNDVDSWNCNHYRQLESHVRRESPSDDVTIAPRPTLLGAFEFADPNSYRSPYSTMGLSRTVWSVLMGGALHGPTVSRIARSQVKNVLGRNGYCDPRRPKKWNHLNEILQYPQDRRSAPLEEKHRKFYSGFPH